MTTQLAFLFALTAMFGGMASTTIAAEAGAAAKGESISQDSASLEKRLAGIEDVDALARIAKGFAAKEDWASEAEVWKRLVQMRPHLGWYKLSMAAAYARQDKKSEAYTALLELQSQGYAYDLAEDDRFSKIATTEAWQYIVVGFDSNRKPFGAGSVAYTLPKEDLLIESLAFDPSRKKVLVGSARTGAVYLVNTDGKLKPLVTANDENGLWAVFDLAVDAKRNRLWVASTAVPHFEGYKPERDLGRAGVFEFALDSGKFIKSYLSPEVPGQSFFLSSLAVGSAGEVYASDGVNNAVYLIRDGAFKRLFHAPRLTSIRGMSVGDDGKNLYFADHALGVMGIDLVNGKAFDVRVPKNLALGGIDGLLWLEGSLYLVQNDMNPKRVIRLKLGDDGHSVAQVLPLEANQPALSMPTQISHDGNTLYVLANSQKNNYDRFGLVRDKKKLEPTRIYRLKAEFTQPEMDITPFLDIGNGKPSKPAGR